MVASHDKARVGVDIGGTFTDVALELGGKLFSTKVLTDYTAPERAIVKGVGIVASKAGIELKDIGVIIHGTTLATNALIERRGAKTAFITTEGFRDTIEMRTENRFEQYDLNIKLPPPLIERCDRYTLSERIDAQGGVLLAPTEAQIERVVDRIEQGGYESIAVGFIHAYVNGVHERMMRDAIEKRLPNVSVSISSEVSPQIREFERFNTVCANAYVRPIMKSYLDRLLDQVRAAGAVCPIFIIHSGGGIVSIESASEFPVRLVESGPAGGAIFAAHIAAQYGLDTVLSFDMGGTTAKICLIDDFTPKTANTFEVARTYRFKKGSGMPISIPVVEMVEIGAGGGSIASLDVMRQIRVGPHSAASEPGPACYQRGGTRPTVTDADLLLGRLDPNNFAGGSIPLSIDDASRAMLDDVGGALSLTAEEAAYGVAEVVDENMSNAARVHAVESGKDIGDYTMITFGGAGPLHAARLCEKSGIKKFVVPPGAGVGSAIGFLRAPFGYESVRSASMRFNEFDANVINEIVEQLSSEANHFARQGSGGMEPVLDVKAFMRYVGQGWEIPIAIPYRRFGAEDRATFTDLFTQAYTQFFGRPIDGLDIEIVSWAVKASSPLPPVERLKLVEGLAPVSTPHTRRIFDAALHRSVEAAIVERSSLRVGETVVGPAIIVEPETSTLVTSSFNATVQPDGCLLVTSKESTAATANQE
ncbi:hydantoinase/oxoprolinase family protein [Burkholderia multivorans]|uniref:hydantoinase/oxoprolinase family protein n=1 Tax=Burkholderia multivorans TaxID=87883 RepID=UPI001C2345F5|nr:hydantoinase/oxoprolinase family protein [Burkholderia multivorans]MBU9224794.1 hydantoinase/oxoprolinase family protein [Burkholderia multivorans]MBU9420518.1 hydantoinase/oxoprolinase family protein [Burkholderia multivorans]MBU9479646.1 hydantoinase/oxoprolinase family protein [Burkholderia multivorans]